MFVPRDSTPRHLTSSLAPHHLVALVERRVTAASPTVTASGAGVVPLGTAEHVAVLALPDAPRRTRVMGGLRCLPPILLGLRTTRTLGTIIPVCRPDQLMLALQQPLDLRAPTKQTFEEMQNAWPGEVVIGGAMRPAGPANQSSAAATPAHTAAVRQQ